jgi:cyclopropane fatty-acyl-phospholipid synthase-like methyltransferase
LTVRLPPYFDRLIEAFAAGQAGRHVHLGYWDAPPSLCTPCAAGEFEAAQARLCDLVIALAGPRDGERLLDVGCGFGGTLAALDARWRHLRLVGLNIDLRQLDICRGILPREGNSLSLVQADASAPPFRPASFDRVFCLEAMFHFPSRAEFLSQAARLLRPGGRLVLTDILLARPSARGMIDVPRLEQTMRREYGPWPQLWISADEIITMAHASGLKLERRLDASAQTLPSYRITAPSKTEALPPSPSAGDFMRWLHRNGFLKYACFAFGKVEGD